MDADAEIDAAILRNPGVAGCHRTLDFDGTAQCIDHTG